MDKIFVIKEKNTPFNRERSVCAFTNEAEAKRFCRDMRSRGELYYETIDLNPCSMQEISAEKLYKVVYELEWSYNKDTPETDAYNDLMNQKPIALVDEEYYLSVANGCLRSVRLETNFNGTTFSFWCYAKNAPAAIDIMKRTLANFDPSVLKWGVYTPMRENKKELEKRIERYNKMQAELKLR